MRFSSIVVAVIMMMTVIPTITPRQALRNVTA